MIRAMCRDLRKIWVLGLVILAFVMAGVSPACKFVGGQKTANTQPLAVDGVIEICTLYGVQTIRIADGEPVLPRNRDKRRAVGDCAFCLNAQLNPVLYLKDIALPSPGTVFAVVLPAIESIAPLPSVRSTYNPRGPPVYS